MSSDIALGIHNLCKCYQIYKKPHHRLLQAFYGQKKKLYREFWALKNVSFDVLKGETIGIIGANGSGKSTLLQMVAGTLTPTSGTIEVNGRVAALLELGAGFNPEFSGRENVYMNASIMGIPREKIEAEFDELLAFANIGDFIDRPVKTYSSGMYVRLAFSISIHMDPDILIVDEALAVGDIRFQNKCFRKFAELQEKGVTILFVTHSTEMIIKHCQRAVFLDQGGIMQIGKPKDVVHEYLNFMFSDTSVAASGVSAQSDDGQANAPQALNSGDRCRLNRTYNPSEYRWGNGKASIVAYTLEANGEIDPAYVNKRDLVTVTAQVVFDEDLEDLIYGLTIKTPDGVSVYGTNSLWKGCQVPLRKKGDLAEVRFSFRANLAEGDYFISLGVAQDDAERDSIPVDRRYDLIHLKVVDEDHSSFGIAVLDMDIEESVAAVNA